jgi:chromosome segregation ATPase
MSAHINQEVEILFQCIATTFGDEIGQAVNEKIAAVLAIEGVDVAALQAQIATLNQLLASNTSGDTNAVQNILSALAGLSTRVDSLEGSTAVATLQAAVAALQAQLATETQDRQDADAAINANVATLQTQVDNLSTSLVSIQAAIDQQSNGGGACDCAAIAASIASLSTSVANLEANDADQTVKITALQAAVEALSVQAAGIASAVAVAQAAQAAAQAAAIAAAAAQATASGAATAAAAAGAAADAAQASAAAAAADVEAVKAAIRGVNCVIVGSTFRTALRGRMGLALGQSNGTGNNG